MANSSIPNSNQVSGPILTRSLRRSKRPNSRHTSVFVIRRSASSLEKRRRGAVLQSARRGRKIRHWKLGPGYWAFSSSRRVKGAWWPSRSSKPSSPCKWRGRFDSYPLRHLIFDFSIATCDFGSSHCRPIDFNRKSQCQNRKWARGGEPHVA